MTFCQTIPSCHSCNRAACDHSPTPPHQLIDRWTTCQGYTLPPDYPVPEGFEPGGGGYGGGGATGGW
jgi:hypothetical protein